MPSQASYLPHLQASYPIHALSHGLLCALTLCVTEHDTRTAITHLSCETPPLLRHGQRRHCAPRRPHSFVPVGAT